MKENRFLFAACSLAFTAAFIWLFHLRISDGALLLLVLSESAFLELYRLGKKQKGRYLFLAAALFACGAGLMFKREVFLAWWKAYQTWLSAWGTDEWGENQGFQRITVIIFLLVSAVPIWLLQGKQQARKVLGLLFFGLLLFLVLAEASFLKCGLIAMIFYCVFSLMEYFYERIYGYQEARQQKAMGYLSVPLLLLAGLLTVMPYSQNPYSWSILKHTWMEINKTVSQAFTELQVFFTGSSTDFAINFTGYSENGNLGGSLIRTESPAMDIRVGSSLRSNLYLTGNIRNIYEKNGWRAEENTAGTVPEYEMDTLELLFALYRAGKLNSGPELYMSQSIDITYLGLYTRNVFYPLKAISFNTKNIPYGQDSLDLCFDKAKGTDMSYKLRYIALNYNSSQLTEFIKEQAGYPYGAEAYDMDEFRLEVVTAYPGFRGKDIFNGFEQKLKERRDRIRKDYLQIPDDMSDKIRELALSVTRGCSTEYEKLKAMESYLQTYTYTLTPPEAPGGQDMIEHFLFDSREGYCTYFASAYVLMSRSIGIPARYVSGFCVPVWNERAWNYQVTSDKAHAWPEAYLEGIGWIPFEPVGTFSQVRYTPWVYGASQDSALQKEEAESNMAYKEETEWEEDFHTEENKKADSFYRYLAVFTGILFGIFLVFFAVVFLIRIFKGCRKYKRSAGGERLAILLEYLLGLLEKLGMARLPHETLLTFEKRIAGLYHCPELSSLMEAYMKAYYGNASIGDEELSVSEKPAAYFEEIYRNKHGRIRLLILRLQFLSRIS